MSIDWKRLQIPAGVRHVHLNDPEDQDQVFPLTRWPTPKPQQPKRPSTRKPGE